MPAPAGRPGPSGTGTRAAASVRGRPPHGGSRSPRCWPWSGLASCAAAPRPGPAAPASSWPLPRRRLEPDHARVPRRRGSARRRARTRAWHGPGSMLLAPEPREVESSPHSPPTSLTVKIGDGGRDCGGSGKNHAVKSYGDQETLTRRPSIPRDESSDGPRTVRRDQEATAGMDVLQARDLGHPRALASMTRHRRRGRGHAYLQFTRHTGIVLTSVADAVTTAHRREW